jgi:hypothetical protein
VLCGKIAVLFFSFYFPFDSPHYSAGLGFECRRNCQFIYNLPTDQSDIEACHMGCDFYQAGSVGLCQCACVSANSETGLAACKTGCELYQQLEESSPLLPPNVVSTTWSPTQTDPTTTERPSTTSTSTTRGAEPTTANTTIKCVDNDAGAILLFEELLGMSLSCSRVASMNGCVNKEWMEVIRDLCPVSCGSCVVEATEKPPKLSKDSAFPIIPVVSVLASLLVLGAIVALLIVRSKKQGKVAVSHLVHQEFVALEGESSSDTSHEAWMEARAEFSSHTTVHTSQVIFLPDFEEPVETEN